MLGWAGVVSWKATGTVVSDMQGRCISPIAGFGMHPGPAGTVSTAEYTR